LTDRLKYLDQVIRLHEVPVDPQVVEGCRPQKKRLAPYGHQLRFVLEQFREARGQTLTTTEITVRFLRSLGMTITADVLKDARGRVKNTLNQLVRDGEITGLHQPLKSGVFRQEGHWTAKNE
jgi:hypothetical protein